MTPSTRIFTVIVLTAGLALPAWGQNYLLYAPQPAASGQKAPGQDGVLVQEIEIQKGDTLYGLSRKYNGKGMYFPQILLFNSIKNPNLIYAGKMLKVPLSQSDASASERTEKYPAAPPKAKAASGDKKSSAKAVSPATSRQPAAAPASTASTELSLSDLKTTGSGKGIASRHKKKTSTKKSAAAVPAPPKPEGSASVSDSPSGSVSAADSATGQKLFEAAVKAYRKDDCSTALELLDRYLADNSGSPLAADATLYKAECYLKLSAQ
ncbi:MAG: hypothetical protein A2076_14580 [Geobacteraceae bacterium GWC2_53_11]|nr:MAG: hypothetical protein A2076_14580 [Geobacteraceae bacterium GWC2_53_11]